MTSPRICKTMRWSSAEFLFTAATQNTQRTQAAVAEANHQYQQALFGFLTARADLEKALGE